MSQPAAHEQPPALEAFTIGALTRLRAESGRAYLSFLGRDTLHCGLYVLPAGATDGQGPHDEDEVYHVISGKGKFTVDAEDGGTVDASPGAVLFVGAKAPHRFHDIEEELRILVFFSRAKPA